MIQRNDRAIEWFDALAKSCLVSVTLPLMSAPQKCWKQNNKNIKSYKALLPWIISNLFNINLSTLLSIKDDKYPQKLVKYKAWLTREALNNYRNIISNHSLPPTGKIIKDIKLEPRFKNGASDSEL